MVGRAVGLPPPEPPEPEPPEPEPPSWSRRVGATRAGAAELEPPEPEPPEPTELWSFASMMAVAVTVVPETRPMTVTWSPVFTSAIVALPGLAFVVLSTANVVSWPSSLFAVMDVALTAVTVPVWRRWVTYVPVLSLPTKSPCRARDSSAPPQAPGAPAPPR